MNNIICKELLNELEAEAGATRKCLERIPPESFTWKPHEKSMNMLYLAMLVAEIPKWISVMIDKQEINFHTFEHSNPANTEGLVKYFDDNMKAARKSLSNISDDFLSKTFTLKNGEHILFSSPLKESISSTLNHWVHHRGQLTVYMRLKDIPVPSIYGPSADDKGF